MRIFVFLILLSCNKVDIIPKLKVSPNPSQAGSYVNFIIEISDSLKRYDKFLSLHFIFPNSEQRKVIKLTNENLYQVYIPDSLINYSAYLILDTFTVKLEGIRVYEGSKPKKNTFFISSKYAIDINEKLRLLKIELENYPDNLIARAYYDCIRNEKSDSSKIYEIYYNICKNQNDYKSILKAIEYGDSSYELLLKASIISDTILDLASKRFPDDMELQVLKLKKLNQNKRFDESVVFSDFLSKNLNIEWLYKFYPHLDYKKRNEKFFEIFSELYKQRALAYLGLNDSLNYRKNFAIYCLNYPFIEKLEKECK